MILADVNTLIYAFNADLPEHDACAAWLATSLAGREEFALVDTVLSGFVRIATNPRVWSAAASTGEALAFVEVILSAQNARWLPTDRIVWDTFAALVGADRGIRGNHVPGAYLAAMALTHGARIATADRGFARYPGLRWFNPLAG